MNSGDDYYYDRLLLDFIAESQLWSANRHGQGSCEENVGQISLIIRAADSLGGNILERQAA